MIPTILGIAVVVALVTIAGVRFVPAMRTFFRLRGKRLVTCPETLHAEAVDVDAGKAALAALRGKERLSLAQCSRWPERKDCGQECLEQVESDPENCLVWKKVSDWYAGQKCVYCQKTIPPLSHFEHAPAALLPDHTTIEWVSIHPEDLPEILSDAHPVCWSCHVAETFRRTHPELVTERKYDSYRAM